MADDEDIPFFALGNDEPLPPGLPPELRKILRESRTRAGWCDHGIRLANCIMAHPRE